MYRRSQETKDFAEQLRAVAPRERLRRLLVKKPRTVHLSRAQWSLLASWQARPFQIVIVRNDRKCPVCRAVSADGKDYTLDIGREKDGTIFGCLCWRCGFSY